MATIEKKYLDLEGLSTYNTKVKELIDAKVDKETGTEAHTLGAYKIATNKDGLVTETAALSYGDITGTPDLDKEIGKGNLTLQVNGTSIGSFNANAKSDSTINIKLGDLGLASAMRFLGTSTTDPTGTTGATIDGYTSFQAGDVCLYDGTKKEYVYDGTKWLELGDEGSHALKTIKITGTDGLTGGGSLEANREIKHAVPTGAAVTEVGAFAIATDKFGHVTQTKALSANASEAANHKHTVTASGSVSVPTVTATSNKKLNVTVTKDTDFLTSVTPVVSKLSTVSIIPAKAGGSVIPAVAVSTENRPTKTTYEAVTASKATAGTPIVYGKANRAATATTVGNANVDTKATTVGNANVGAAAKVAVSVKETGKNVYDAKYDETTECLQLTVVSLETAAIAQAVASTASIHGAVASTTSIYGAEASETTFTPYTFKDVAASNITANTAVDVAKAGTAVAVATVDTAVDVATGKLSTTATGDSILTGVTPASAKAVTAASLVDTGTTGVAFVSDITVGSESKTVSVSGNTSEAGKHTHTVSIS